MMRGGLSIVLMGWLGLSLNSHCAIAYPGKQIYQAGAVYGTDDYGIDPYGGDRLQDARVTIGGVEYRVKLMEGAGENPAADVYGYDDHTTTHGSEWNRVMYRLHTEYIPILIIPPHQKNLLLAGLITPMKN
jgi:hypothetical protein